MTTHIAEALVGNWHKSIVSKASVPAVGALCEHLTKGVYASRLKLFLSKQDEHTSFSKRFLLQQAESRGPVNGLCRHAPDTLRAQATQELQVFVPLLRHARKVLCHLRAAEDPGAAQSLLAQHFLSCALRLPSNFFECRASDKFSRMQVHRTRWQAHLAAGLLELEVLQPTKDVSPYMTEERAPLQDLLKRDVHRSMLKACSSLRTKILDAMELSEAEKSLLQRFLG